MMLCGVVVESNCACIWINCSRRLFPVVLVPADAVEPVEALAEFGAVVIATLEPLAKSMVVVVEPLLLAALWLVAPLAENSACSGFCPPWPPAPAIP